MCRAGRGGLAIASACTSARSHQRQAAFSLGMADYFLDRYGEAEREDTVKALRNAVRMLNQEGEI